MSTCKTCDAPIIWAKTGSGDVHRRIPLDEAEAAPDARGALVLVGAYAYDFTDLCQRVSLKEAVPIHRARELIVERYKAHLTHFATCPQADQHRRG